MVHRFKVFVQIITGSLLPVMVFALLEYHAAFNTWNETNRIRSESVTSQEYVQALVNKHDCWFGNQPQPSDIDVPAGILYSHGKDSVVVHSSEYFWVLYGLSDIFEVNDHSFYTVAFCRN